jgi:YD repeat-containing protein
MTGRTDYRGNLTRYQWDAAGMIAQQIDPLGNVTAYSHDPLGRITEKLFSDGSKEGYRFDANGNRIERERKKQMTRFVWDKSGRLAQARHENGSATTMAYDALGRRISKETNDRKTTFCWDGDRLLSDRAPGEKPREFVHYPGSFVPLPPSKETMPSATTTTTLPGCPRKYGTKKAPSSGRRATAPWARW